MVAAIPGDAHLVAAQTAVAKRMTPATRVDISGNRPERPGGYNSKGESLERPKDNAGPIRSGGGGGPALGPKPKETKDGS